MHTLADLLLNITVSNITMFTGKGGVGKTTCAAATALHHAVSAPTLAISTDATPSLSHIFEISGDIKPTGDLPYPDINEVGEEEIKRMWDEKFGGRFMKFFRRLSPSNTKNSWNS